MIEEMQREAEEYQLYLTQCGEILCKLEVNLKGIINKLEGELNDDKI